MFPSVEAAVNRGLMWTDSNLLQFGGVSGKPRRIVGVAADIDDENIVPGPVMTVYSPGISGRLFVRTRAEDPYTLVPSITRIIRQMSADQPVERPATLEDVRAEVLTPDRLNALVFGGFALVALTIAIVGVAGVLAFSVSARMREFGIRLAIGSAPRHLLARVLGEGAVIAAAGIVAGALGGIALTQVASGAVRRGSDAGRAADRRSGHASRDRGDPRVAAARCPCVACGRRAGAAIGVTAGPRSAS